VEAGEHLDSVSIGAVVKNVGEALKDRPAVSYCNLGEGFRMFGDYIHRVFESPDKVGTEPGSPLVVPLPSRNYVRSRFQSEADPHSTTSPSDAIGPPPTKRIGASAQPTASQVP